MTVKIEVFVLCQSEDKATALFMSIHNINSNLSFINGRNHIENIRSAMSVLSEK
jgi:hypothetical protein